MVAVLQGLVSVEFMWLVDGSYLGSRHGTYHWSVAFFCPSCGEIYARAVGPKQWQVMNILCWKHRPRSYFAASALYHRWLEDKGLPYPKEVLAYDFLNFMESIDDGTYFQQPNY